MSSRATRCLGTCILLLTPLSCRSLPQTAPPSEGGPAAEEALPSTDAVPIEWGDLAAVSYAEPNMSLLWFQDDSGVVRVAAFSNTYRRFWPNARVIRRR